jgi:hypothetical protein
VSNANSVTNITAPTQFLQVKDQQYAYRRFGSGAGLPLLFLQHFTGTLDNWDPAVTDALQMVLDRRSAFRKMILVGTAPRGGEDINLPNAVLTVYPDAGHGSLFQFHAPFTRQAAAFLASDSPLAPC